MTEYTAAEARIHFADLLDRANFKHDRVLISRRGKKIAALIPIEDLEALEALEEKLDNAIADRRLAAHKSGSEGFLVPWEQVLKHG